MINGLSLQGFIFSPPQLPGRERHLLIDIMSTLRPSNYTMHHIQFSTLVQRAEKCFKFNEAGTICSL